jgi:hypothetical protein
MTGPFDAAGARPTSRPDRHWLSIVVGAIAVITVAVVTLLLTSGREPVPNEPPSTATPAEEPEGAEAEQRSSPEPAELRMPLTGVVTDELPAQPALLVKISNSPEARPYTGIEVADLVYEEVVEGGATRFMAVFHSELPPVAGPVRSARPVDTQLIAGFDNPGFAYSGAREEVREMIARTPAVALNEHAPSFFRDNGSYASTPVAPHNLFLRPVEALAAVSAAGAGNLGDLGWVFTDDPPTDIEASDGAVIDVVMSTASRTTWTFDPAAGVYRRQQNGAVSHVTGPGRIGAANVVVLEVRHYVGASGYPETNALGTGDAIVLRDGERYLARWSKNRATDPLRILTADGAPFPLAPGRTWIHLPEELPA